MTLSTVCLERMTHICIVELVRTTVACVTAKLDKQRRRIGLANINTLASTE